MIKVCVLGSNAFSGQDFVDLLLEQSDYQVLGISRSPERPPLYLRYRDRSDLSRYQFFQMDLNHDLTALLELLDREQPAYIVNFAAQSEVAPSWEHPEHWYQTNTVALALLINHLRRRTYVQRYLHISSPEVYGTCSGTVLEDAPLNPSTPYAASKAAADGLLEVYRRQYGWPLLTVRATNVYGARQQLFKIIPRTAIYLKLGRVIQLHGGGQAVKSYIHIRDVSRGELAILENGQIGELYHLSPDAGVAVREVVRQMCQVAGQDFATATATTAERPGQDAAYVIDSHKARQQLGWKPTVSLETGLAEVMEWVDKNWKVLQNEPLEYLHKP